MKSLSLISLIIFLIAVFGLTDPTGLFMPSTVQMTLLIIAILFYAIIIGFVFREKPQDEREVYILHTSSRQAFLIGTITLIIAITVQTITHNLDNWLVWSLSLMLITKVIGIIKHQ